jgi:hypothetical protein
MRSLIVLLTALASSACLAAPPSPHNPPELRRVLGRQVRDEAPPPRQLSPEQRAELRRQLGEFRPRPRRNP